MKSMKLMKWLPIAAQLLCLSTLAHAGGETGNGGGGILRDGTYLTFGTAGYRLRMEPLNEDIPGLELLEGTIRNLPLSADARAGLVNGISPSSQRRYFKIDSAGLSASKDQELKQAYRKAMRNQLDDKNLTFFALTSPSMKETYLLPSFFKLTDKEQAAILFHEAIWVIQPKADYSFVISSEITMQRYIESGGTQFIGLYRILDEIFKNYMLSVKAALIADFKSGALKNLLIQGNKLPLLALLGPTAPLPQQEYRGIKVCIYKFNPSSFIAHLDHLRQTHPSSLAIKRLYEVRERVALSTNHRDHCEELSSTQAPYIELPSLEQETDPSITIQYDYQKVAFEFGSRVKIFTRND